MCTRFRPGLAEAHVTARHALAFLTRHVPALDGAGC
jgi:hypothetical protein